MSRFHVYKLRDSNGLVMDLQADFLETLKTRIVAPLLKTSEFQATMSRLAPTLEIDNTSYIVATHLMSAVLTSEIGEMILDATEKADLVTAAVDFVFQGF